MPAGSPACRRRFTADNVPPANRRGSAHWGGKVVIEGAVWDESNQAALAAGDARRC